MPERIEAELLHHDLYITVTELARSSGFSDAELIELVELGAFTARRDDTGWVFTGECVELARAAQQWRIDFELSLPAVALLLAYRARVRELEDQLRRLTCQLPSAP